jgi:hypothetical protein
MTSEFPHTWSPAWGANILTAARSLGFETLTAFLGSLPSRTYSEVADRLGKQVAPIQIIAIQFSEAKAKGTVRAAAMDCLSRNIVEQLPDGWGKGTNSDWRAIKALSNWSSEVIATGDCGELEPILDNVMEAFSKAPPDGWIPIGANDPIIEAIFDEHYPSSL